MPHGLPTGQVFAGRFQILKLLSQERRHALTYQAVEQPSGEQVILREVREDLKSDPAAQQELLAELKRLSQLNIQGISPIRGLVRHEGRAYLLMPFSPGHTLRQIVARQGPLTPDQARSVLRAAAGVLNQLHRTFPPLLHLDISPDTLLLAGWDQVTLLDGAWLKALGNPGAYGVPLYRTEYAAPETLRGQAVPASDLYALGVSLVESLTHVPASRLHNVQVNRLKWDPIPDAGLESILHRLVEGGLADRLDTADKLLQALASEVGHAPVSTKPLPAAVQPPIVPGQISRIGPESIQLTAAAAADRDLAGVRPTPTAETTVPSAPPPEPPARAKKGVKLVENIDELSPEEGLDALLTLYEELNS